MTESERFERVAEIFDEVRDLDPIHRSGALEAACSGDHRLRAEVEALLDQHQRSSPLDAAEPGVLSAKVAQDLGAPDRPIVDGYELGDPIGEGGMGIVFEATQLAPRRAVAIKVIKKGMDSARVLARFDAERQAIARMEHPGIAAVFDAGFTADGRPYFVMERVRGSSLIEYSDRNQLALRDRLKLFGDVCRAIRHAHQKGVIHRDIKPSNVLVAERDGEPVAKVIDFGIAKATDPEPGELFTQTADGQVVGTPAYMSPEQAVGGGEMLDTRSDIYSLGVLLYELLTGTTPFSAKQLTGKGLPEMLRVISEVDPATPSTRLSTLNDGAEQTASARGTSMPALVASLTGDLDWIAMRCLEKDPARRYESADALSADIDRYFANEPVIARPATSRYKIQKFASRHRAQVVAGGVAVAALMLGMAGTTWGMIWAMREQERAGAAAAAELAAQVDATRAAELAASEAEAAEELSRFFIMDVLSAADPARTADRELTVRDALANASENIEGRFAARPDVESRIHNALGYLFGRLGSPELAERHHRRELAIAEETYGTDSIEAASMLHSVVGSLAQQGRDAEAIELTERQLKIIDELGTEEANRLRSRAIGNLGALLVRDGRNEEAVPILEETLALKRVQYGDRHPTTLATVNALASVLGRIGEPERRLELAQEAHSGRLAVLGEGDPRTFITLNNLANARIVLGEGELAGEMLRDGIDRANERLGPEHPTSIDLANTLARLLLDSGDLEDAESVARSSLTALGTIDPSLMRRQSVETLVILATSLREQGRLTEAEPIVARAVQAAASTLPEDSPRHEELAQLSEEIRAKLDGLSPPADGGSEVSPPGDER